MMSMSTEIGSGLRHLNEPFERAMDSAEELIAQTLREHWRRQILTIVGGPAHKIAYITGAFWDSIAVARRVYEGGVKIIEVESDHYQDLGVWQERMPGIGNLIEVGEPGYPGRFQAKAAVESSEADVQALLSQHIAVALRIINYGG